MKMKKQIVAAGGAQGLRVESRTDKGQTSQVSIQRRLEYIAVIRRAANEIWVRATK